MKPEREKELRELASKNTPQGKLAKEILTELDEREANARIANGFLKDSISDLETKVQTNVPADRQNAILAEALRLATEDVALLTRDSDTDAIKNEYLAKAKASLPA